MREKRDNFLGNQHSQSRSPHTVLQNITSCGLDETIRSPARFRYIEVPQRVQGLGALEILALSDRELNGVLGLKKLGAYMCQKRGCIRYKKMLKCAMSRAKEILSQNIQMKKRA